MQKPSFYSSIKRPSYPRPSAPVVQPAPTSRYPRNDGTMLQQLTAANRYRALVLSAGRKFNIAPAILCGVGSRESHWGLALKPKGPTGRGDFAQRRPRGTRRGVLPNDGPGYGRGLMQIDYDWHEFARTGRWYDARENIYYACTVLDNARTFLRRRAPQLNQQDALHAMLAAYNCGATATLRAIQAGQDIDANTTGRDYGRDALERAAWFQQHGW